MKYNTDHFLRKLASNSISDEDQNAFRKWLLNLAPQQQKQILDRFETIHAELTENYAFQALPFPEINYHPDSKRKTYFAIAASVSLLFIAVFTVLFLLKESKEIEYFSSSENENLILEDGTNIQLMPNSSLKVSYTENFRKIELSGEALFQVYKDKKRPMIVTTEGVTTTVLGTTFKIKQLDEGLLINLMEGSISVNHNDVGHQIAPNQQWYLNRTTDKSFLFNAKSADFEEVRFENESLEKIIAYVEMRYNLVFKYNSQDLKQCKISITIGNAPLLTSLELIEFATALTFEKSDEQINVFGKCN